MNKCPICNSIREKKFSSFLLNKYSIDYFYCNDCGFLQTEFPHWLEEAYGNVISDVDTGLLTRNISISKKLSSLLFFCFDPHSKYLDIAGGYGTLTRLMRDIGFDFFWEDPYCNNILAKGFDFESDDHPVAAITAFEVLEHIYDPIDFIQKSLSKAQSQTIIFSTELFIGNPPTPDSWWYYLLQTGQHISFYQYKTLERIARNLGMNLCTANGIHMLSYKKVPNYVVYQMLTGKLSSILSKVPRIKMSSKTFSDHKILSSTLS